MALLAADRRDCYYYRYCLARSGSGNSEQSLSQKNLISIPSLYHLGQQCRRGNPGAIPQLTTRVFSRCILCRGCLGGLGNFLGLRGMKEVCYIYGSMNKLECCMYWVKGSHPPLKVLDVGWGEALLVGVVCCCYVARVVARLLPVNDEDGDDQTRLLIGYGENLLRQPKTAWSEESPLVLHSCLVTSSRLPSFPGSNQEVIPPV